ncbi:hypothetical protein EMIHUDRAFT_229375 [Emiliania huxleyi CCMP1516]|uniref:COX assembly mitochondrial protein n=2 Tax=Emiliania huxleyi TaxID=2903 RepID=A0A0D3KD19_EMIH1|nr:hypothetical protein EMIHUDRAFT_258806 [Emiliania huxleyi CCMP1516]XP_005786083.1 hypothetical protein EMIHUDRAFT_229375 [Emiliania huxleyi CCMP1516]EOD06668.1 hypothetical protein EMIHUDRAFT_258806 [Emiliania huxleyi CCMP1516]EOD33654.1 hypothetical protein EMIHUDRAFT_229375 [Emiliania huxleyi CCMP1516]|mmetsp:Transcript_873/g.2559  ORF Transcript_873/g.2559 Transcript_873/m.2559 type:complete len:84 (-) Transcript_873:313-564(-)|eukprot:XP_005759097.1 hypothetical protein EMIHUDRAFT_258806 [Emiliania huxleyi CCMP1516]
MPDAEEKSDARDGRLSGPKSFPNRQAEFERKQHSKRALELCADRVEAYAECATGRTITLPFYCRGVFNELNECLKQHKPAEQN